MKQEILVLDFSQVDALKAQEIIQKKLDNGLRIKNISVSDRKLVVYFELM